MVLARPGCFAAMMAAGAAGALVYGVLTVALSDRFDAGLLTLTLTNTPAYLAFVLAVLLRREKLRWAGALWLIVAVTGGHHLATQAAVSVHTDSDWPLWRAGGLGGIIGAGVSFAAMACLRRELRTPDRALGYAGLVAVLAALGAAGVAFSDIGGDGAAVRLVLTLYIPWQLAFTAAIAWAFRSQDPVRSAGEAAMPS
ncbi:MAG: hypothetical protein MI723_15160 [Caulobacterales bacterium]|nr:hypothetical protein [Caulobacterales bacterium]